MGRKDAQTAVSKISSASASSMAAATKTRKSSILKSAFAPSQLQLHLFASVIQSFDSHRLRIHDTATGRLRSQHDAKGSSITCLDWGFYGDAYQDRQQSKKKRKRDLANHDGAVVAYGTNTSQICMFSPAEARVVGTLSGGHERGIKDFRFSPADYLQAWSIGQDSKLVQWDLSKDQPIRTINLSDPAVHILASPSHIAPHILCASSTPFTLDITSSDDFRIDRFDSFKNPVHSLWRSSSTNTEDDQSFLAADSDRYINVYQVSQKKLVRTLVASSGVVAVDLSVPSNDTPDFLRRQMLCVLTKDGIVELFTDPFVESKTANGDIKTSRKNLTRKSSASVRLISSDSKSRSVPIVAAFLQGPEIIIVSAEGGVDLAFERVRWQDEGNGELLFDGEKQVVRTKSSSTLNAATLNGVKDMGKTRVDESTTVVVNGGASGPSVTDAIEISSSENEEEEDEESSADEASTKEESEQDDSDSEVSDSDEEMADADPANPATTEEDEAPVSGEEPSFGELLASRRPTEISISAALPDSSVALILPKANAPSLKPGMSLSTVLSQALRTNDTPLLEACLHTPDPEIIQSTMQRLDSNLAGLLLSKLAERLASKPGRYGHLITWVQWTCIAHGGAIASQPDVIAKVKTLYQVLNDRMKTLDDLLLLKGKLDLLDAQLQFRRQLAAQRGTAVNEGRDEPGMIYVEGNEGNWDSDDDLDEDISRPSKRVKGSRKDLDELVGDSGDEEDSIEGEDLPLTNGGNELSSDDQDEDEEEYDESDDDQVGAPLDIIDDEASVSEAEDSDPDDVGPSPAGSELSSEASSDDEGSEEEDEEEDEEDSELEDFINDGSVDFDEDAAADEVRIEGDSSSDEDEDGAAAPPAPTVAKKSKHKVDVMDIESPKPGSKSKESKTSSKFEKKVKAKKHKH